MALQGGTVTVAAGAVTATVLGTFAAAASFEAVLAPNWVTSFRVTAKSATQFTVDFATPAPAAGGSFDWLVLTGVATGLASGAVVTVPAGALAVSVVTPLSAIAEVIVACGWVTDVDVVSLSTTGFTINFSTPCPAGGATLDWIALVGTSAGSTATPLGAPQAIAAGVSTGAVTLLGTLALPYEVLVTPGWVTGYSVTGKTTSGFTVNFAVPAPTGGSTFYWIALAVVTAANSLAGYLAELRELLHDPFDVYWTAAQKVFYINKALQKRDRDTGQNRTLITFATTIGVDTYTFTQMGNPNVFDLIGINLLYNNLRVVLGGYSFSELNARIRQFQPLFQWAPVAYTRYGPNQFIVAPAPAIAYQLELDCAQIVPANYLVNLTDADVLPAPFDAPVAYWAARIAKYNERQYQEAGEFEENYYNEINRLDSNKVGMVPSLYSGGVTR